MCESHWFSKENGFKSGHSEFAQVFWLQNRFCSSCNTRMNVCVCINNKIYIYKYICIIVGTGILA